MSTHPRTKGAVGHGGLRAYLRALGPGVVTGASDDDPSGVATYAQAGARYRFGLLWLTLVTFPLMCAVQEICDRTALATGESLGRLVDRRFSRRGRIAVGVMLVALVGANILNIAADLLAIGEGTSLLHLGPVALWAALGGVAVTLLVVLGSFQAVAKVFKLLCLALLAYVVVLFVADVPWGEALGHFVVPHVRMERAYIALVVAVLGTTISPYLFFWQSAHRVEELREEDRGGDVAVPITELPPSRRRLEERASRIDVFSGMALSQLVMFAIIVATAASLNSRGTTHISSAAEAAGALEPVVGSSAKVLFALGFIGSGFLAVPVLAGSGSAGLSGLLRKDWGFSRSPRQAPVFYGLVALGTVGGSALTLVHVNAMSLLVVAAVVNGVAAAPFLVCTMLIASDGDIMGDLRNGRLATVLGWATVVLMSVAALALVLTGG